MTGYSVHLDLVTKSFGESASVISGLNLHVEPGEFVAIVGKSGIGKTTLLRIIAGLEKADSGHVQLDSKEVSRPPARLGYLVQDYSQSLFPWLTIARNLALATPREGHTRSEILSRVLNALNLVSLPDVANRYPWELSGGMQQRVALARAFLREPRLLLLDEPFASVDALVRMELEDLTRTLVTNNRVTAILITHDVDEAVYVADRVVVLGGSPAAIEAEVRPRLPRSRQHQTTRSDQNYLEARDAILELLTRRK